MKRAGCKAAFLALVLSAFSLAGCGGSADDDRIACASLSDCAAVTGFSNPICNTAAGICVDHGPCKTTPECRALYGTGFVCSSFGACLSAEGDGDSGEIADSPDDDTDTAQTDGDATPADGDPESEPEADRNDTPDSDSELPLDGDTDAEPEPDADTEAESDGESAVHFSFFVTSLAAIREFSGNQNGFGGDLRFGEIGPGAGLRGADKICATIAEKSLPGSSSRQWRAFLSVSADENGKVVNAIERIGNGPWYDRLGRLFAPNKASLLYDRPQNGDPDIKNDFPNENGLPNHRPDLTQPAVDNHDMLTGSSPRGLFTDISYTCKDWTANSGDAGEGKPRVGHSWPRFANPIGTLNNWMSALDESGCAPGINLLDDGDPKEDENTVGSGGGYGGFYCFALVP